MAFRAGSLDNVTADIQSAKWTKGLQVKVQCSIPALDLLSEGGNGEYFEFHMG